MHGDKQTLLVQKRVGSTTTRQSGGNANAVTRSAGTGRRNFLGVRTGGYQTQQPHEHRKRTSIDAQTVGEECERSGRKQKGHLAAARAAVKWDTLSQPGPRLPPSAQERCPSVEPAAASRSSGQQVGLAASG